MSILDGCALVGTTILEKNQSLYTHSRQVELITGKVLEINPKLAEGFDPEEIRQAALYHDLGKATWVNDYFTESLVMLDSIDKYIMDIHPIIGSNFINDFGTSQIIKIIIDQHHERPGGKGYPNQIMDPLPTALLIGAVDAYVACLEPRPYRPKPLPVSEALREAAKVGHGGTTKVLVEISKTREGRILNANIS